MNPGDEQRLEDLIRTFQLEIVQRLTSIETDLKEWKQLRLDVRKLRDEQNRAQGARKILVGIWAVMQLLITSGIVIWVNTQT